MKHIAHLVLLATLTVSCAGSKSEIQREYEQKNYEEIKALVLSREFDFFPTACYPLQTNAVEQASNNLFRNTNNVSSRRALTKNDGFFRMRLDSISCSLPYIGEIRATNYVNASNAGINFNALPIDYKVKIKEDKQSLYLSFRIKNDVESFNVNLEISNDKSVLLNIYSISRSPIRYLGYVGLSASRASDK